MNVSMATLANSDPQASMRVPFNDLSIQWRAIADDVRRDFERIFADNAYCLGPACEAFEEEIAAWLGARHAIGVSSGTAALHLAAVVAGLGPGDEVLVPANTFIGSIWGAMYVGATPVLCDVHQATGTIDLKDARSRVTASTKAIIPVHLYGQPADMDGVMALAAEHDLVVIEDAAQSIGASWRGRMTGTIGHLGCISFYPGKNLGAAGESGLVLTNDAALAERLHALRNHGQRERYVHAEIGFNYRMDGLQAVVLRHKLKLLTDWTAQRKALAAEYDRGLAGLPLEVPKAVNHDHVWHLYVVRTPHRDGLRAYLSERGIETGLHYPVPLHRQPCLASFAFNALGFPEAERWASEGLSLPLFVGMTSTQQRRVVSAVGEFFGGLRIAPVAAPRNAGAVEIDPRSAKSP
jgi:dTDP-4-amino-4,6-dideoxygalactose transaminase